MATNLAYKTGKQVACQGRQLIFIKDLRSAKPVIGNGFVTIAHSFIRN
ncbi:hypothetical protein EKH55_3767 [Sinorhizobium alkalisoli]|nr:hypothetical protein EKH55_3767 [Sinorhizobium alkalisoli]